MKEFILTPEMLRNAKVYMTLYEKEELSHEIANLCIVPQGIAEQNREGNKFLALPCLKAERPAMKAVLLQNILISYYLGLDLEQTYFKAFAENEAPPMTDGGEIDKYAEYDYFARAHLLTQIENYKRDADAELKQHALDLIADFRDFKKMVEIELYNIKQLQNDPLGRFTASIQLVSTPENMKHLIEELQTEGIKFADLVQEKKAAGQRKRANTEKGIAAAAKSSTAKAAKPPAKPTAKLVAPPAETVEKPPDAEPQTEA